MELLRDLREDKDLSQNEIAKMLIACKQLIQDMKQEI